jgi:hypothetical protein
VITGIWNVIAVRSQITGSYETTLVVRLIAVTISGATAFRHAHARSNAGRAVFGALTGVSALAALFLGIWPAGSGGCPSPEARARETSLINNF